MILTYLVHLQQQCVNVQNRYLYEKIEKIFNLPYKDGGKPCTHCYTNVTSLYVRSTDTEKRSTCREDQPFVSVIKGVVDMYLVRVMTWVSKCINYHAIAITPNFPRKNNYTEFWTDGSNNRCLWTNSQVISKMRCRFRYHLLNINHVPLLQVLQIPFKTC